MQVRIDKVAEQFVEHAMKSGRNATAQDVAHEGWHLVAERDAKIGELRKMIKASIALGGQWTHDDLVADLAETEAELAQAVI